MQETRKVTVKGWILQPQSSTVGWFLSFSPFAKFGTTSWKGGLFAVRKGGSVAEKGGGFWEKGGSAGKKGGTVCSGGLAANAADKAKC